MVDFLLELDTKLFLALNGWHSPFWDSVMLFASGKLSWLPLYLLLVYFMVRKLGWKALWWLLAAAVVVLLADQVTGHAFKYVYHRLRPCHNPDLSSVIHLVGRCGGKYGFISAHAANSFGVATLVGFIFYKRWATIGMLVWAAFVSYSRIYLGVHYPGDVLVGAVVGSAIGIAVWLVAERLINRKR